MRRDLGPLLLLLVFMTLLASFAWLTRHPEAEILRRAEDWPAVGPLASWMRRSYLPPGGEQDPSPPVGSARGTADRRRDASTGAPALPPRASGAESPRRLSATAAGGAQVWVLPGTQLRAAPSATAEVLHRFDAIATTTRLERQGDWFRILHGGSEGWVFLEGYDESGGPPYGDAPEPPRALAPRPPDKAELAAARRLLRGRERVLELGPYTLYTDCNEPGLIGRLDTLAQQLESVYMKRYDRQPLGSPRAALVLYQSELPYRILLSGNDRLVGLHSSGHAARGLAVLFVGDRGAAEVGSTLVHELAHFLNRRALGPALPPWIDEGIADDLASARVEPDGALRPDLLGGERRKSSCRVEIAGALAALHRLQQALRAGRLRPLRELLELDWEGFVRDDRMHSHYAASAFWVRYLLQGEGGRHAEAFRRYLDEIAEGAPATAEGLRQRLGWSWEALERGRRDWIELEARRWLEAEEESVHPTSRPSQNRRSRPPGSCSG